MPLKDQEVQLAAVLGRQVHILQEQSPGAGTRALIQKGTQSGHYHSPHQLVDGELAGANKAKAAHQVESPMLVLYSFFWDT
jgi:hypothetical protein